MARELRVEVEGGLYHVITRWNDRQDIFHSAADYLRFLTLLIKQKARSPFYLYAYCLMTNHGSEEFVDTTIHRIGDTPRRRAEHKKNHERRFDASALISAIETVFALSGDKFCGPEKSAKAVLAKEVLILIGRERGAGVAELSLIAGLDTSNISRRYDAAQQKLKNDAKLAYAKDLVEKKYQAEIGESQA